MFASRKGLWWEYFSISQVRSKKDLIHEALREYIRLKKRKGLTELAGTIEFYEGYNHKELRKTRDDPR
jgi:hypothetical protein